MPIAPVLQRFVDDELSRMPALIERVLAGCQQRLRGTPETRPTAAERTQRFALLEALQAHGVAYRQAFVAALQAGVRGALDEHRDDAPADTSPRVVALPLIDESSVEIDIEISRAMQLIDTTAEWELRELQTFTATLVGQTYVTADSNPLRALVYATALWEAACAVSPSQALRTALLRVSAGVAAGMLKHAWAAASTRLESQGVAPGIYRTVLLAPGATVGRGPAAADASQSGAMASLLASMPGSLASLHIGSAAPVSSSAPWVERQGIELLARLFDNLLSDPRLPPAFAAVLARLQTSASRLASHDPELFDSTQHPVWRLLDRIGEAAAAYSRRNDPRAAALLSCCDALAEPLARANAPDAALYRHAQSQLDAFLNDQRKTQLRAAQPEWRALQLAERREILAQQLSLRLIAQMASMQTSPGIRRFISGAWARVLAESMLRDGEQGESTRSYLQLVDELLWSVQLPDHPQSRERLIGLLPSLLQRLRAGMALIDLPSPEQSSVLRELMTIHAEVLRSGGREEPVPLTSAQIVQRMRDEVLPPATGEGGFGDSAIDLGAMEAVPAEPLPESSTDEAATRVDALHEADRLRLFLHARWAQVQLLWRSDQGLFFLFAGEVAGRTHSVTRGALEKLAAAGLMQPPQARALVQRALDSVARELVRPS